MSEEQTATAPTEEQVMAALSDAPPAPGTEPTATEQTATNEAPPEAGKPAEDPDAKYKALLEQALNPLKSELGQLRKLRSEWSRSQQSQTAQRQAPPSYAQMTPEQQAEFRAMMKHAWQEEFGADWEAIQSERQNAQKFNQRAEIYSIAEDYAGEQFKTLDPIMGDLLKSIRAKADEGDTRAQRFYKEIYETESGVLRLVDLAKQEYAKSVQGQAVQAEQKKAEQRKSAALSLSSTNQAPVTDDSELARISKISDPGKKAEAARKYWQEKGVLE